MKVNTEQKWMLLDIHIPKRIKIGIKIKLKKYWHKNLNDKEKISNYAVKRNKINNR